MSGMEAWVRENPQAAADYISRVLFEHCPRCDSEVELQFAIGEVLEQHSISFQREVSLTPRDRIDFIVAVIGIEIKIAGSRSELIRQLHRYAQSDQIESLILVTTRLRHRDMPSIINGKTVTVVVLENWA